MILDCGSGRRAALAGKTLLDMDSKRVQRRRLQGLVAAGSEVEKG
jgi:hypothetical protein